MISRSGPGRDGLVRVTFTLPSDTRGPVSVVGDFNDWDPYAHPMPETPDGRRTVTVEVPAGYSFAFRYLGHGGCWFDDPQADAHDHRGGVLNIRSARSKGASFAPDPDWLTPLPQLV